MTKEKGVATPMFNQCKLRKHGTHVIPGPFMYRSKVGALQYLILTRPN